MKEAGSLEVKRDEEATPFVYKCCPSVPEQCTLVWAKLAELACAQDIMRTSPEGID